MISILSSYADLDRGMHNISPGEWLDYNSPLAINKDEYKSVLLCIVALAGMPEAIRLMPEARIPMSMWGTIFEIIRFAIVNRSDILYVRDVRFIPNYYERVKYRARARMIC